MMFFGGFTVCVSLPEALYKRLLLLQGELEQHAHSFHNRLSPEMHCL